MKRFLASAVVAVACMTSVPALATTWTSAQTGASFMQSVNFNGIVEGNAQTGLTGTIDYTLNSVVGNLWTFGYKLTNTSGTPITASRISIFGFDVTPDALSTAVLTGVFNVVAGDMVDGIPGGNGGQVPQKNLHPDGSLEFCYKDTGPTNNCTGGASGGVLKGNNTSGSFSLLFTSAQTNVSLVNHLIRYQSIAGSAYGDSAIGLPTNGPPGPVPEPATWAMMISGFGLAGVMIRRARREHALAA